MKLFKSLIAASVLGLCVNAQSMELVDFARKNPYITTAAAGSVFFNAYQFANKIGNANKKNTHVKKHAQTLETIYKTAKAINAFITDNTKFSNNNSALTSLSGYVVTIQEDLPDLADKCSRMIANAMIVFSDSRNENKRARQAYDESFTEVIAELTPMVSYKILETPMLATKVIGTVKGLPMNTVVGMANMAKKYPKLSLTTGISGLLAYQYKYKQAVTDAITQGIGNAMFGTAFGISNATEFLNNKWVKLGAAGAVATSLLVKYYDKLPKITLPSLRRAQVVPAPVAVEEEPILI